MKGTYTGKSKKNIRAISLILLSLVFAFIAFSIAIVACNYIENRNFKETFYNVSSLKVNNKIRIVQISDLHDCSYGEENDKLISRIEKLKPDVIIFTGDLMDSSSVSNDAVVKFCESLSEVAPSYYIYGNNEVEKYYDVALNQEELDDKFGFNDYTRDPSKLLEIEDELERDLEDAGVTVLKNESDTITVGTTQVDIYGVLTSNPSAFWSYAGASFDEYIYSNENNLKITAIHEPLLFSVYTPDTWGDLVIAGHTHGGIVRVPMLGPLYAHDEGILPERSGHYIYGRHEVQGRPLIISSGLENKNVLRLNNPPELVIVDINKF